MHSEPYYVYMYLRETDQTPYYVGKGTGSRMFACQQLVNNPENLDLIKIVKDNLSYQESRTLELELIEQYGLEDNKGGIMQLLPTVVSRRRKVTAEERLANEKIRIQKKFDRAQKQTARDASLLASKKLRLKRRVEKKEEKRKQQQILSVTRAQSRQAALTTPKVVPGKRKLCPCCLVKPVAICYTKNSKTYYRKKCDQCSRKRRKPAPAGWIRSGYKKKPGCEKCGFRFTFPEQAEVFHLDGNVNNNDWVNLKTVCLNCAVAVKHSGLAWKASGLTPDS